MGDDNVAGSIDKLRRIGIKEILSFSIDDVLRSHLAEKILNSLLLFNWSKEIEKFRKRASLVNGERNIFCLITIAFYLFNYLSPFFYSCLVMILLLYLIIALYLFEEIFDLFICFLVEFRKEEIKYRINLLKIRKVH